MSLRLQPSLAARERRLARLLAERGLSAEDSRLAGLVEDALVLGSLELAGVRVSWEEARASAGAGPGPPELAAMRNARRAVAASAPVTLAAVRAWHDALAGPVGFRRREAAARGAETNGDGLRPAPVEFVESRLQGLADWLEAPGSAGLEAEQKAAVALARLVEIRPFDDANGRVSRLLAAHVMARAGQAPPILVAGDAARLRAALHAAFRLDTAALVDLVSEASSRSLDVRIQALERGLL